MLSRPWHLPHSCFILPRCHLILPKQAVIFIVVARGASVPCAVFWAFTVPWSRCLITLLSGHQALLFPGATWVVSPRSRGVCPPGCLVEGGHWHCTTLCSPSPDPRTLPVHQDSDLFCSLWAFLDFLPSLHRLQELSYNHLPVYFLYPLILFLFLLPWM